MSIYAACMMLGCYLLQLHVDMWFHAGWDVRKWLQRNLARKFLTMSEHDIGKSASHAEETTRRAIETTAAQLTDQCYGGFHGLLSSLWSILASLGYLFTSGARSNILWYPVEHKQSR